MQCKQAFLNIAGNFVYLFSTWMTTIIVVRLVDFQIAGDYSLAITITAIFYVVSSYGMRAFQVSDVLELYQDRHYVLSRGITASVGFLMCVVYVLLAGYTNYQSAIILWYMIYKTCEALSDVCYGVFQKQNRFELICISLSLKGILSLAIFMGCLWITKSLMITLVFMSLVSFATLFCFDLLYLKKYVKPLAVINRKELQKIGGLLQESFWMMLCLMVTPLLTAIPRIYYEKHFSTELFGVYSSISAPTVLIPTFVSCALMPFVPQFAQYYQQRNSGNMRKLILQSIGGVGILGGLCVGVSILVGDFALGILYGKGILPYADILESIVVASTCSAGVMCLNSFYIGARKLKMLTVILFIGCLVSLLTASSFIDAFKMFGIGYTLIAAQVTQVLLMFGGALYIISRWKSKQELQCERNNSDV